MPCYHPVPYAQDGPGKPVRLNPPVTATTGHLPCGGCLGCKARRANDWATRCMHEASLYEHNRFLTLTYSDEHLPPNGWLAIRDVQLWMKRLRKAFPQKIRYFLTGEYGSLTARPHYHALLFNCRFQDERKAGKLIISEQADRIWQLGDVRIGLVTQASAGYVAKYSIKSGKGHPRDDGTPAPKPFATMSRGGRGQGLGGIGAPWLTRYEKDLQHGYIVQDGRKTPIPRAYRKRMAEDTLDHIEYTRYMETPGNRPHLDKHRLEAAEKIHEAKLRFFDRQTL